MKICNQIRSIRYYQAALGYIAGLWWYLIVAFDRRRWLRRPFVRIHLSSITHPVAVRTQGSSDIDVFEQLFVRKELEFLSRLTPPATVIDLGANVGYFSAYTLSKFKSAKIVAVEPDPGNAEVCRKNLAPYGARAVSIEGAAWHTRTGLVLSRGTFRDGREWATEVRAALPGERADVQGWDMSSLIDTYASGVVDLLKVDIEGSEGPLFSLGAKDWLGSVRNLCIEVHGEECERAVFNALEAFEFEESRSGEYSLFLNLRPKKSLRQSNISSVSA